MFHLLRREAKRWTVCFVENIHQTSLKVSIETAGKVLAVLSRLVKQEYTLETVRINLDHEEMRNARKQQRGGASFEPNTGGI